ncbi:hypothetical protein RUM44_000138 [Polyplax serrata]|uniref:Uncharacterized protein n=1 Tax=Polyplax serrata TaxID=468196 RepID=A0ABR1B4M8_POLSC
MNEEEEKKQKKEEKEEDEMMKKEVKAKCEKVSVNLGEIPSPLQKAARVNKVINLKICQGKPGKSATNRIKRRRKKKLSSKEREKG